MANRRFRIAAVAGFAVAAAAAQPARSEEKPPYPFFGDAAAIAEGRTIYRSRCYICHLSNGARGPNLFASTLAPDAFAATVATGRNIMPAFGSLLSADDIWKVHAFIRSTDKYE
jgi:mono/diheme cytochrome c family protein